MLISGSFLAGIMNLRRDCSYRWGYFFEEGMPISPDILPCHRDSGRPAGVKKEDIQEPPHGGSG